VIVNPGSSRLHAATISIPDPGLLTDFLGPRDAAFLRGREGFIGLGQIARFETDSMLAADQWWTQLAATIENESEMPGRYGTGPLVCGSFCFDPGNTEYRSVLVVPELIIGRRGGKCWLTRLGYDRVTPELPERVSPPRPPVGLRFSQGSLSESEWMGRLRELTGRIRDGEARKVVLARDIVGEADRPLDPRWPLRELLSSYGGCWTYLIEGLVGSTPEMLVRRRDGLTGSRVLAGTIPRVDGVDDVQQAARLVSSIKDLEEHRLAVESVVSSLRGLLTAMHVPEAPYVLTLPNVMHLATDVTGVSAQQHSTLRLAQAAHPSAAVCGSPTDVARRLIAEHEQLDRGRFAGPVGWMDTQGDGEWAIALRCGQLEGPDRNRIRLYAGAGVVAASNPHTELVETEAKLAPMKSALRGSW